MGLVLKDKVEAISYWSTKMVEELSCQDIIQLNQELYIQLFCKPNFEYRHVSSVLYV
jgi:hypothetical protein